MAFEFPTIDPVAFSVAGFDIRWYALSYVAGFLLGWRYCIWAIEKYAQTIPGKAITRDHLDVLLSCLIIGVLIGGRLGYVIFYQPIFYFDNPSEIIKIWQGGMSFHGGLLGVIIAIFVFSVIQKVPFWVLFDVVALAAPIGLFFGRIANFINAELYGRVTNVPWAITFPTDPEKLPRHPSQLYESLLEGAILWIVMFVILNKTRSLGVSGLFSGVFLFGYGFFRFLVEFTREPDAYLGVVVSVFTMGQLLCIPMMVIGGYLIYRSRHHLMADSNSNEVQ